MFTKLESKGGFTLIELLVVIAILSILLVIVLVAINPAKQTRDARDSKRRADVIIILSAVNQYFIQNNDFPLNIPNAGDPAEVIGSGGGQSNICSSLVPVFVAALPLDPNTGSDSTGCGTYDTEYTISISATNDRVTISAPNTEGGVATISATR